MRFSFFTPLSLSLFILYLFSTRHVASRIQNDENYKNYITYIVDRKKPTFSRILCSVRSSFQLVLSFLSICVVFLRRRRFLHNFEKPSKT